MAVVNGILSVLGIFEEGIFPLVIGVLLLWWLLEGLRDGASAGRAVVARAIMGGMVGLAVGRVVGGVVGTAVDRMVGRVVGVMVGRCETEGATLGTLERVGTTEGDVEGR